MQNYSQKRIVKSTWLSLTAKQNTQLSFLLQRSCLLCSFVLHSVHGWCSIYAWFFFFLCVLHCPNHLQILWSLWDWKSLVLLSRVGARRLSRRVPCLAHHPMLHLLVRVALWIKQRSLQGKAATSQCYDDLSVRISLEANECSQQEITRLEDQLLRYGASLKKATPFSVAATNPNAYPGCPSVWRYSGPTGESSNTKTKTNPRSGRIRQASTPK